MGYPYNLGLKFYEVASRNGSRVMLKLPSGDEFTFGEVNALSNRIARYLLNVGLKAGSVVAVFNEKSLNAYATMIACLKIGAVYTNIDSASPWQRLQKILSTCQPAAVFFDIAL